VLAYQNSSYQIEIFTINMGCKLLAHADTTRVKQPLITLVILFLLVFMNGCTTQVQTRNEMSEQLVGLWKGASHYWVFYGDGHFFVDPEPEGRPLGTWRVSGESLYIRFPEEKTERWTRIVMLNAKELKISPTLYGQSFFVKR
jgi:hypothetical protein